MGGNTYFRRKYYTNDELKLLVDCVDGYTSLFKKDVVYDTKRRWQENISRHLDQGSCNRFHFMLEETHYCKYCECILGIESYFYAGWQQGFFKYCPECTRNKAWNKCLSSEHLEERGKKISESKLKFYRTEKGIEVAKNNSQKISRALKEFHKTSAGEKARAHSSVVNSEIMRNRILNNEFTPNSNNRNTHWDSYYNNRKYRSSWEALYHYHDPDANYESLRVPYTFNNKRHIYIVDFVNHKSKKAIEVKPKELTNDERTQCKIKALKEWCDNNGYTFILVDKEYLLRNPEPNDYSLFDEKTSNKIRKFYEQTKN